MSVVTKTINIKTKGNCDIVDVTRNISREVLSSSLVNGNVTVFIQGSTAGITTIEFEDGLVSDFEAMWARLIPQNITYKHNERWGDSNGFSHIRASLLGASLTIPFKDKKLLLGTWQQVVVVDFDNRPRSREIVIQLQGE